MFFLKLGFALLVDCPKEDSTFIQSLCSPQIEFVIVALQLNPVSIANPNQLRPMNQLVFVFHLILSLSLSLSKNRIFSYNPSRESISGNFPNLKSCYLPFSIGRCLNDIQLVLIAKAVNDSFLSCPLVFHLVRFETRQTLVSI